MKCNFKYLVLLVFLFSINFSFSQTKIDSLKNIFENYNQNNIRTRETIDILKKLYETTKISSPEEAIDYAKKAIEISVEISDTLETAFLNRFLGDIYFNQKVYYLALKSYFEALKIFDKIDNTEEYAFSLMDIAYTYYTEEISFDFAINYYKESIKIFEKIDNQIGIATAYNQIALVYSKQKNYSTALEYLIKSLFISQKKSNKQLEAQSYFDIAIIYKNQKRYSEALGYLENALIVSSDYELFTAQIFFEKGNVLSLMANFEKALENYNFALEKFELNNDAINIAEIYNSIAETYFLQENYSLSMKYSQKVLSISDKENILQPKLKAYLNLANIYAEIGDSELAFRSFNYYSQIKDSIFQLKSANRYTDLQVSIRTLLSEKEKQLLESEKEIQILRNKKQKTAIYLFIIVLILLIGLFIVLYNRFLLKRKSEEKYRNLAELLPATVCEIDFNGNFFYLNRNSYSMFGFEKKAKLSNVFNHIHHSQHERLREELIKGIKSSSFKGSEYLGVKKDGTIFPIVIYSSLLKKGNIPIGFRSIVVDISTRKDYEEKLKQVAENLKISNKTKDKMFSIIAHDLRGPIGNLKTMMELMLDSPEDFETKEITEIITSLKESSVSTYDLLENLLNWAKSQQGLVEYIPQEHNIREIIISSINSQKANADNKKINIINQISDDYSVICDINMIKTVVRNLISNAIKFTNDNGTIIISHETADNQMVVLIKDDGVGIKEENLSKIFEQDKFFTTYGTKKEKGSGLGLILCKEFVEKNNGKIWVESKLGVGTTFYFTVNLA